MKTTEMKHTGARPVKMESAGDSRIYKIAMTGLFAALSYVVFTFLQFKITLPGGDATSIHLGNAVCVLAAAICGLGFNVIADPLLGYYYKILIIGQPAASLALTWNIASTSINAVISTIVSVGLYMPLRRGLARSGLLDKI